MGFAVVALVCGLLGDGTRPVQVWRLMWPSFAAILVVGWVGVALMR
jgi:lactate permease